jgi:thiol-disulfide isomerase/thioredoxin
MILFFYLYKVNPPKDDPVMKRKNVIVVLCAIYALLCAQCKRVEPGIIELPLTMHNGVGPVYFASGYTGLSPIEASPEMKELPEGWVESRRYIVIMDDEQYYYQKYIDSKEFEEYLMYMIDKRGTDTTQLSREPVRCYVNVAVKDVDGGRMLLVDMDNDLDMSDEEALFVDDNRDWSSVPMADRPTVTPRFESWREGRIVTDSIPVAIGKPDKSLLFTSYPRYATAELDGVELMVFSFNNPDFDSPAVIPDINGPGNINQKYRERVDVGYSFKQKGTYYKLLGVDTHRNVLRLEVLDGPDDVGVGTDVAALMEGTDALDFLKPYEGKYVFLDFWGTWCEPCLAEMPTLKEAYSKIDKDKAEFVGIVYRSNPDEVPQVLADYGMTWPQVQEKSDEIVLAFKVEKFPTTFLVDPDGKIVAKDLKGKAVERKLQDLGLLK